MLVCCDNEGCVVDAKGEPFDLAALADLRTAIAATGVRFSICTGRGVPYVEAMVQVLDLLEQGTPCVCECGGVLYHPSSDRYELLTDRIDPAPIRAVLPSGWYREELGKLTAYSVYPEPGHTVGELYELMTGFGLSGFAFVKSIASVDVTPAGVDKALGVQALLDRLGLGTGDLVAIGDSWNDLPMLALAGIAACPANAVAEVKAVADYVSPFTATRGVADIVRWAAKEHG